MLRRWPLVVLLLLPCGCASNGLGPSGHFICERKADKTEHPSMRAPYKATYVLYRLTTPPQDQTAGVAAASGPFFEEICVRNLESGETIGFDLGLDGESLAVVGSEKFELEPGHYCWHSTRQSEMRWLRLPMHLAGEKLTSILKPIFALLLGSVLLILLLPFAPLLIVLLLLG